MKEFIEVPAGLSSLRKRKLIFGVGVNDAKYIVHTRGASGQGICPYYSKWVVMIKRCYSKEFQDKHSTYKDCSVCDEWLIFSEFKRWMKCHDWKGLELDKDIVLIGNKVYHPDLCCFVPKAINNIFTLSDASRGDQPLGVYLHKVSGKFIAKCNVSGKSKYLGLYNDKIEAADAYNKEKYDYIMACSKDYQHNEKIYAGLVNHANSIIK